MPKIKDARRIDGKVFRYAQGVRHKSYAQGLARKYRKGGYLARVVTIHKGYSRVFVHRK